MNSFITTSLNYISITSFVNLDAGAHLPLPSPQCKDIVYKHHNVMKEKLTIYFGKELKHILHNGIGI